MHIYACTEERATHAFNDGLRRWGLTTRCLLVFFLQTNPFLANSPLTQPAAGRQTADPQSHEGAAPAQ